MARSAADRRRLRLIREARRRQETKKAVDFENLLFGPQHGFITDPNQLVLACCSRRAGKTWGICVKLVQTALELPGCTVFYVTNTRRQAERGFWNQALLPFLRELGFSIGNTKDVDVKLNKNELTAEFKNNSRILVGGANDAGEIENYRGSKTPLVVIDEAQNFRAFLSVLVDEVFLPQLVDYGDRGQVLMTGTPNAACHGYFYDAAHGRMSEVGDGGKEVGWSVHGWTMFQNPHLPDPESFVSRMMKRNGWDRSYPKLRREYYGEWVRDSSGLVYAFRDVNLLETAPDGLFDGDWSFVLGIDPGYVDATAFVVLAYNPSTARTLVVESFQKTKLIPDGVAVVVDQLQERYDFEAIVVDSGGLGKAYVETMVQKYGIPAEAAEKSRKVAAIQHLTGDIAAGVFQVLKPTNEDLLHDASLLSWNYDKLDKYKHGGLVAHGALDVDDRTPDHLTDAMLYAYRKCRGYLNTGRRDGPAFGTAEYYERLEEEIWDEVREADAGPRDGIEDELFVDEPLF
jgi:hypothetical protein